MEVYWDTNKSRYTFSFDPTELAILRVALDSYQATVFDPDVHKFYTEFMDTPKFPSDVLE